MTSDPNDKSPAELNDEAAADAYDDEQDKLDAQAQAARASRKASTVTTLLPPPIRNLSRADAIAKIVLLTPFKAPDLEGFLACSLEQQMLLIQAYKTANIFPTHSVWKVILAVFEECAELAALVSPLTSAITGIYAVATL